MTAPIGYKPYSLVCANTTNATSLLAAPGIVGFVSVGNVSASARYLKFYDLASAPTPGTTPIVYVVPIPGGVNGTPVSIPLPGGLRFATGIAFSIVTGIAAADATAPSAADVVVSIGYMPGV
jgi:hypothetical protein